VNLGEWLTWWRRSGERELTELLAERWDPFADPDFQLSAEKRVVDLGRKLHEGAGRVDVQAFLQDWRHTRWPRRTGRKWTTRDRRTAENVLAWYHDATGE
jgi:hypothetical protein